MPELPEVEALALDLRGRLTGRAITKVHIAAFSALKTYDPPLSAIEGTLVDDVRRHGKFLDIEASGLHLVFHLARAGWVRWKEEVPSIPPRPSTKSTLAVRVVLDEVDGLTSGLDVTEAGTRKSLALYLVRSPAEVAGIARLGPDPLDDAFTRDVLAAILESEGRKQLKGVLRHQGTIAGIGNAYSDEILHAAKISPVAHAAALTEAELDRLFDTTVGTITSVVEARRGIPIDQLKAVKVAAMRVHGRAGEACPVCGDTIRDFSFASTTAQYCPTDQTHGELLPLKS